MVVQAQFQYSSDKMRFDIVQHASVPVIAIVLFVGLLGSHATAIPTPDTPLENGKY